MLFATSAVPALLVFPPKPATGTGTGAGEGKGEGEGSQIKEGSWELNLNLDLGKEEEKEQAKETLATTTEKEQDLEKERAAVLEKEQELRMQESRKGMGFAIEYDGRLWTGYSSLLAAMQRALAEGFPITDLNYLHSPDCSEEVLRRIFRSATMTEMPLLTQRIKFIKEACEVLCKVYIPISFFSWSPLPLLFLPW